jgi:hypothetical protein
MKWAALFSTLLTLIFAYALRELYTFPLLKTYTFLNDPENYNVTIGITVVWILATWGLIFCLIGLYVYRERKPPKL